MTTEASCLQLQGAPNLLPEFFAGTLLFGTGFFFPHIFTASAASSHLGARTLPAPPRISVSWSYLLSVFLATPTIAPHVLPVGTHLPPSDCQGLFSWVGFRTVIFLSHKCNHVLSPPTLSFAPSSLWFPAAPAGKPVFSPCGGCAGFYQSRSLCPCCFFIPATPPCSPHTLLGAIPTKVTLVSYRDSHGVCQLGLLVLKNLSFPSPKVHNSTWYHSIPWTYNSSLLSCCSYLVAVKSFLERLEAEISHPTRIWALVGPAEQKLPAIPAPAGSHLVGSLENWQWCGLLFLLLWTLRSNSMIICLTDLVCFKKK